MRKLAIYSLITLAFACSPLSKADKSFEAGEYNEAIALYEKGIDPHDAEHNFRLAESYRRCNRLHEAEPFYAKAVADNITDETAYYFYAVALKSNKKQEEAKKVLESYIAKGQDPVVVNMAQRELDNLDELTEIRQKVNHFRVKNLKAINTPAAEYSPVYNNGTLFFTSNRDGGKIYKGTGTPFTNIYRVTTKGANVDLATLEKLPPIINDPDVNEGSITMSANGRTVIFAKGNNGKSNGSNEVNLYFTRYRNSNWSNPRPININGADTWDSTPALSPDGQHLYFSSNRPGGFGGLDIYQATLDRRGRWVDVHNMGEHINTPGNEIFPYVGNHGELYFSSDGWPGFGGLDVFHATRDHGHHVLENLGQPINSTADDFGIFLFNPSRGFFTSNRPGGKGDDDIYTFVNDDPDLKIVNYYLTGKTVTPDEKGELAPLSNTKVLLISEDDEVIDEVFTKLDGKYRFPVYSEENYYLLAEKDDYFTSRQPFTTIGKSVDRSKLKKQVTNVTFEQDLELDMIIMEKPIVLNNIFYDLNKADIRADAAAELDKLVVILNDNPDINIELSSHTDVRAGHDYNMDLSQRRAESAVAYIISQGIDGKRMVAKGYGETKLIVMNAQTEEEHQQNRRTEFKVTKYTHHLREDVAEEGEESVEYDETDRFFNDDDEGGNE